MSFLEGLFDAVLNPVHKFLMKPGWPGNCKTGFHAYEADGVWWCIADFPENNNTSRLRQLYKDTPAKEIWQKDSRDTKDVVTAHGKTCPPGTFGSNGLCYSTCPEGFVLYKEPIDNKTYLSCRSKCENGWHPLDWTPTSDITYKKLARTEMYQQDAPHSTDLCWHALPLQVDPNGEKPTVKDIEEQVDIPYNLAFQEVKLTDEEVETDLHVDEGKYGPQPVRQINRKLGRAGVYAARIAFNIGAADPPMPCYAPNQITSSGKCVKPCDEGFTLYGEVCWDTKADCPANSTDDKENKSTACIPHRVRRKDGPSIIAIIAALGLLAIIGGLIVKLVVSKAVSGD